MRRRKARSVLTCATLVLLTFIVLSFTSVVQGMRFNVVPSPGAPRDAKYARRPSRPSTLALPSQVGPFTTSAAMATRGI